MTKLKIKKKTSAKVNTKYGEKTKFNLLVEGEKGSFWADAWQNETTNAWKEMDVVEAEIVEREYNGKTYFTLKPKVVTIGEVYSLLLELKEMVAKRYVESIADNFPPPPTDEDAPNYEEDDGVPY